MESGLTVAHTHTSISCTVF